ALRANPLAHDPLQHVMRALQPLRGLAALNDLPPLPDLLEGIERAIAELSRSGLEPPANLGELFQIAGSAIARAAREVAERGRPDPEGADFRQFAGLLVKFMESEPDVVSIGSLYYSDSGPHIVSRGVPAARPSTLGRLELVSHGEHLRQAADSLERAPSATQRELRAHTLGTTFRALADAGTTAGRGAGGSGGESRPPPRPTTGRAGDTRNARPRRVVGCLPAVGGGRNRLGIVGGTHRRSGHRGARTNACSQLPAPGSHAALGGAVGRGRPRAVVSRRARAPAGPGAARSGEAGIGRRAPRARRRSLRPRCPRPRAQPLVGPRPRAGGRRGSWGSWSPSASSPGRCTAWTPAR